MSTALELALPDLPQAACRDLPGLTHCQACGKRLTAEQRAKLARNCSPEHREAARNARRKPDRTPTGLTHCQYQHCQKLLTAERRARGGLTCGPDCSRAAASARQRERRAASRTRQEAA